MLVAMGLTVQRTPSRTWWCEEQGEGGGPSSCHGAHLPGWRNAMKASWAEAEGLQGDAMCYCPDPPGDSRPWGWRCPVVLIEPPCLQPAPAQAHRGAAGLTRAHC